MDEPIDGISYWTHEPPKAIAGEDIHLMDMFEIGEDGKAYKADLNSENAKSFFCGPAKEFVPKDCEVEL